MSTNGGQQGGQPQGPTPAAGTAAVGPQLNVLAQYTKDLSFENPNAPKSLGHGSVEGAGPPRQPEKTQEQDPADGGEHYHRRHSGNPPAETTQSGFPIDEEDDGKHRSRHQGARRSPERKCGQQVHDARDDQRAGHHHGYVVEPRTARISGENIEDGNERKEKRIPWLEPADHDSAEPRAIMAYSQRSESATRATDCIW